MFPECWQNDYPVSSHNMDVFVLNVLDRLRVVGESLFHEVDEFLNEPLFRLSILKGMNRIYLPCAAKYPWKSPFSQRLWFSPNAMLSVIFNPCHSDCFNISLGSFDFW